MFVIYIHCMVMNDFVSILYLIILLFLLLLHIAAAMLGLLLVLQLVSYL